MKRSYFLGGMVTVFLIAAALTVVLVVRAVIHSGTIVEKADCQPDVEGWQLCTSTVELCDGDGDRTTGSIEDCVTNSGPCAYDSDDAGSAPCYFADIAEHAWIYSICPKGKVSGTLTIRFEPQGIEHSEPVAQAGKDKSCINRCVVGLRYERDFTGYERIPWEELGGGGRVDGTAVRTTVSVTTDIKGEPFVRVQSVHKAQAQGLCVAPLTCEGRNPKLCWPE